MEKLLRSCDIDSLYILVRSKKGKTVEERCDEIFDDAVCEINIQFLKTFHKILIMTGFRSTKTRKTEIPSQNCWCCW